MKRDYVQRKASAAVLTPEEYQSTERVIVSLQPDCSYESLYSLTAPFVSRIVQLYIHGGAYFFS